jgi:hypothetical protein
MFATVRMSLGKQKDFASDSRPEPWGFFIPRILRKLSLRPDVVVPPRAPK